MVGKRDFATFCFFRHTCCFCKKIAGDWSFRLILTETPPKPTPASLQKGVLISILVIPAPKHEKMTIRSGDVVSQMRKKKGVGEDSSLSLCLSLFLSLSFSDEEEEGCGGGFIFLRGKTPSVQPSQS